MGEAIGQVLGNGVGVAVSPVPIIAVILMLFSSSAARNSLSFLAGWIVGLAAVATLVLALGLESREGESSGGGWLRILIGVAFLLLAVRQWRRRPGPGADPAMPSWMATIDDLSWPRAFIFGVIFAGPNPKNLGLTIAAATGIGAAGLSTGEESLVVIVYIAIASVTILAPVVAYLVARDRSEPILTAAQDWLTENNGTVMTVLFVVLGAKVLGDGIAVIA